MIYAERDTPVQLAAKLARYISDPSTIRARVRDHFGRAPSLQLCAELRREAETKRATWPDTNLHADRFKIRCATHDGPYEVDIDGYDRCKTCADEKRREEGLRELAHLKRLIALRKEKQEQLARQEAAAKRLKTMFAPGPVPKTSTQILLDKVAEVFSSTAEELAGQSRERHLVAARTAFIRIMRLRGFSYPQIGRALGGRDHSSIINLDSSYDARIKYNTLIADTVEALKP